MATDGTGLHEPGRESTATAGRVAGKVVVITGAARGQGAAEARALAAEGATVVATDLVAAAEVVPGELDGHGDGIVYRQLDVDRPRRVGPARGRAEGPVRAGARPG